MRFGTCNVRSLYRSGSLTAGAMELARWKLHLEVCRRLGGKKEGTVIAVDYIFSMEDKTKIIEWERGICGPQNIISS